MDQSKFDDYQLYCMTLSDFEITKKLGKGSFGEVFLATYKPFLPSANNYNKQYCLKIIPYEKCNIVIRGLYICPELGHENLVKCYGHFSDTYNNVRSLVLIMEYVLGKDLHDVHLEYSDNELTIIVPIIIPQIIHGLQYLHSKNIIHRDIKLENILLTPDNKIKIADYDFLTYSDNIKGNDVCGTVYYNSPELSINDKYDCRTDIWSVGIVMYMLLIFNYPFYGSTNKETVHKILNDSFDMTKIPSRYKPIITGLLEKDPNKRISLDKALMLLDKS